MFTGATQKRIDDYVEYEIANQDEAPAVFAILDLDVQDELYRGPHESFEARLEWLDWIDSVNTEDWPEEDRP